MLLFVPFGVGAGVGIILLALTSLLKKKRANLAKLPSFIGLIASIIVFIISFQVRGFEGAAYGLTAGTIFLFTIATFVISKSKPKTESY